MKSHRLIYYILLSIWLAPAYSCQCMYGIGEGDVHFKHSDIVFHARIIKTEIHQGKELSFQLPLKNREDFLLFYSQYLEASYVLLEKFKGNPKKFGVIRDAPPRNGNCNIGMKEGVEYLVYQDHKGLGFTSSCAGSFAIIDQDDIKMFHTFRKLFKKLTKKKVLKSNQNRRYN